MEKTIEFLSGKLTDLENMHESLAFAHNETVKLYDGNFEKILKWHKSQKKVNKLTLLVTAYGIYILHKQNKEIKALKVQKVEQENTEE